MKVKVTFEPYVKNISKSLFINLNLIWKHINLLLTCFQNILSRILSIYRTRPYLLVDEIMVLAALKLILVELAYLSN